MSKSVQNYAVRTLLERLDYLEHRSKPSRPNTAEHAASIRAALKILEAAKCSPTSSP